MISATMLVSLIRMFIEGPLVSLNGSPTVSPVTAALCGSLPFLNSWPSISTPFSKLFLALSQAPPALFWKMPMSTPLTVMPASRPPRASGPKAKPTITGLNRARAPGRIISRMEAWVLMATHFSYSGLALPSMIPGISLNWRRTSFTMSMAALPTALMAMLLNRKGIMPPTNNMASTLAL